MLNCRGVYLIRVQVQGRVQDKKLRIELTIFTIASPPQIVTHSIRSDILDIN